jgi:hypothetical protein
VDYQASSGETLIEVAGATKGHVTGKDLETKTGYRADFHVHSDGAHVRGELEVRGRHRERYRFDVETLAIAADRKSAGFSGVDAHGRHFRAEVEAHRSWWGGHHDRLHLWIDGDSKTRDGRLKRGRISIRTGEKHDGGGSRGGHCRFGHRH